MSGYVKIQVYSGTATPSFTPTNSADLLYMYIVNSTGSGDGSVTSVTGSLSGSWTRNLATFADTDVGFESSWYKANCPSGADTITIAFNGGGTPGIALAAIVEYTGMALTTPLISTSPAPNRQVNPGTGANAITTTALSVPSGVPAWVICLSMSVGDHAFNSAGSGTARNGTGTAWGANQLLFVQDLYVTSTGNQTSTCGSSSGGGDTFDTHNVAFSEAASGGGVNSYFFNSDSEM